MRVFERTSESGWGNRLNVVDENNVVVGFDYEASCCEKFGYYFTTVEPSKVSYGEPEEPKFEHSDYVFDTSYIKEDLELDEDEYDKGGAVAFRLVNKEGAEIFLVLYNHHNGYYLNDFEMIAGDKLVRNGSL